MKIASITVYCNEDYRLKDWIKYYQDYKDELDRHIIVNNGNEEDNNRLQTSFPDSIVLYTQNKALTAAYNLGLKYILACREIDAVMIIGNDIKFAPGNSTKLYEFLISNKKFGMVAPILLFKDSNIIEVFGATINAKTLSFIHLNRNVNLREIKNTVQITDSVPGGMNMALRRFYEKIGLQDENLFMYSDEVDIGIRAKRAEFLLAATSDIVAWHQHVNPNNSDSKSPLSGYLMGRNEIYLARKHFGFKTIMYTFLNRFSRAIRFNIAALIKGKSKSVKKFSWHYLKGTFAGIFNQMNLKNNI